MVIERGEGLSAPGVDHEQETVPWASGAADIPRARAASVPTGAIGTARACASPRAVAIPIRSPVMRSRADPDATLDRLQPPPASTQRSISASSTCE